MAKHILAAQAHWRVVVLSKKSQEYKSGHDEQDSQPPESRARRILYWWPPPVGPNLSAEVGSKMIVGIVLWIAFLLVLSIAIGILAA